MLSLLVLTVLILFSWTEGSCPGITGGSVPWWILYQQKQSPFIHYYVDSIDAGKIKLHHPEKIDSVLSRLISGLIDNDSSQYIVYFNDLVNAGNIAKSVRFPMRSKWIYGMLATHTSWTSGLWVMSNNFLFPPTSKGHLVPPGTKQWTSSTIGDSDDDLFYVCLTAGNENDINSMLENILAGNPFVFIEKLAQGSTLKHRLKEVELGLDTSFYLEASAISFLECMYATTNETLQRCLYKYSISEGAPISVFTRPRGMIQQTRAFCYGGNSKQLYDFSVLEKTSSNNPDWSNSMFVLTDQLSNEDAGITCFGQDIAANTETVSIMICVRLPYLYRNLLALSKITKWTCPQHTPTPLQESKDEKTSKPYVTNEPPLTTSKQSIMTSSDTTTNGLLQRKDATENLDENLKKICTLNNCNNDVKYRGIGTTARKLYTNVLDKTSKLREWFEEKVTDMRMQENIAQPTKIIKEKKTTHIPGVVEVQNYNKYLVENKKAVLGLFYRDGCGHCQRAKNEMTFLSRTLDLKKLDILFVDITDPNLPLDLMVSEVPYFRYKSRGITGKWTDYTEKDYDKMSLIKFAHKMGMPEAVPPTDNRPLTEKEVNILLNKSTTVLDSRKTCRVPPMTLNKTEEMEAKEYACKILELHKNRDMRLAQAHQSEKKDNAYAYSNIRDTCNGHQASRSKYPCKECKEPGRGAPGGSVSLYSKLLKYIYEIGMRFPKKITINEIAGACHSCNSKHYKGEAVDIGCDLRKDTSQNCSHHLGINPKIRAACSANGGKPIEERTHLHCEILREKT